MGLTIDEKIELRKKKRQDLKDAEAKELAQSLSVQEQLERKFETDVVKVNLTNDLGEFTLSFRKISPIQQERLQILISKDITKITEDEKLKMDDELYDMLGEASLDGVSAEFWKKKTGYSTGDFVTIITKLATDSGLPDEKYMERINRFRR